MAIFSQYGNGQRVGFALVCIGFGLCFCCSIAPYWISAKTSIKDLTILDDFASLIDDTGLEDTELFKIHVGIWWYCVDTVVTDEKCFKMYDTSDYEGPGHEEVDKKFGWINVARSFVVFNLMLGLACGLVACCRCMCCSGGRTICHGVLSFLAGAAGFSAFLVVYNNTKSLVAIPIVEVDYDWALAMYTIGSIMFIIASLFLCCAVPRETVYGVVMAQAAPTVSVSVSQSTVSQYNAGGQIQSFEPLPNPAALQNYANIANQPTVQHPPPAYGNNQAAGYDYNPGAHPYDHTVKKFGN